MQQIWRDDKFTYLRGQFQETPALYEVKDKKRSLINFDFNDGLYTVPKQLENGYLAIGKQKVEFHRVDGKEIAMPEPNQNPPATVPEQPEAKPPLKKSMPVIIALVAIVALDRHRQSLQPGEREQEGRSSERVADAPCRAECRSRSTASRRSSSCRRDGMPRTGSASRSWPLRCSSSRRRRPYPARKPRVRRR